MVLRTCQQVEGGLPKDVNAKMMFNIIVDFGIGLVPFLGDIADALFRANTKNAIVLEEHLRKKGAKLLKEQGRTPQRDPSDADAFDDRVREELEPPPKYTTRQTQSDRHDNERSDNRQREEVIAAPKKSSWLGGRTKQTDVEQALDQHATRNHDSRQKSSRSNRR